MGGADLKRTVYGLDRVDTAKDQASFVNRDLIYPRFIVLSVEEWTALGKPFNVAVVVEIA